MGELTTNDVLLNFEREHIFEPYREFYLTKRLNSFVTMDKFPYVWDCFMQLDQIFVRELDQMQRTREPQVLLPVILFMNAHLKMRLAVELWAGAYLPEAHSLARDAVESAAHGHRLASAPNLQSVWFKKSADEAAKQAFKQEFEHHKAVQLFAGLPALHEFWKKFSDWGAHTNLGSIVGRFEIQRTATDVSYRMNYTGADVGLVVRASYSMILAFGSIENTFFNLFQNRLNLDFALVDMRTRFEQEKENTRQRIIKDFNVQPPDLAP